MSEDPEQAQWRQVSEGLFRCSLKEFVAQRKALASALMKSGQRVEAERVRSLGKPSLVAWLVNQLYYERRAAWDAALDAGAALRSAQEQGGRGAADVQALMMAHRRGLQHLHQQALALGQAAGLVVHRTHERQLQDTLEAVVIGAVDRSQHGRLVQALMSGGFDALDAERVSHAIAVSERVGGGSSSVGSPPSSEPDGIQVHQALQRAKAQEVACAQRWETARLEHGEAQRRMAEVEAQRQAEVQQRRLAYQALERAQAVLSAAQTRLEAVEVEAKRAREATREAAERVSAAEQALAAAEAARRSAEQAPR